MTSAAMVFFASNSLLCRAALAHGLSDPVSFTALRLSAGAIALALLVRVRSPEAARRATDWISPLALFAYAIGFSLAYVRLSAGTGALLLFGAVQVTVLGVGFVAGERPHLREWSGLGISIAGLVALTLPGVRQPDPLGTVLMAGAGVAWGIYTLRGRGVTAPLAANAAHFARSVPPALIAAAVAGWIGRASDTAGMHLTVEGAGLAVASGAIASGVGYALWYAALAGLTTTRAALVQLSVPPLAALGGVLLLGERPSTRLALSGIAILGGIVLAITKRPAPVPPTER